MKIDFNIDRKPLRTELEQLLKTPAFIRSPVMGKLLRYIVERAIADPENPPKAYDIAVEALGRDKGFDVQADSYPRVQAGRLRKMLEAHYAKLGVKPVISRPLGSYTICFVPPCDQQQAPAEAFKGAPTRLETWGLRGLKSLFVEGRKHPPSA